MDEPTNHFSGNPGFWGISIHSIRPPGVLTCFFVSMRSLCVIDSTINLLPRRFTVDNSRFISNDGECLS